ncbi:MAG: hypothetical protein BMS9Abin11_1603 [Gammaproteobacteria bacterium]|nr:MAG: hypothetical protein BMS9Abin11_1603 [Gammaproteobacteria bacterium]
MLENPETDVRADIPRQQRPVRLLLINPRFPDSFWSFRWAIEKVLPGKRTMNPPLGLATLAALCPADWEVEILDENIDTVPLNPRADIIGVGGMAVQHKRQRELLNYYRKKGYFVVAGGSYASLCPERFEQLAHTIIVGEAEYIWPEFCRDFRQGLQRELYRESGLVDLGDSPVPRYDLLKIEKYSTIGIQYSRGCPFQCDFCDIIVMFGRQPRAKQVEQIGRELDLLRSLDVRSVFFVDDNLIGNKAYAKKLLRYMAGYQQQHSYRFQLGTQASVNLAENKELLSLFRQANFSWVFLGIETPDPESLKETNKTQNIRQDLSTTIRTFYTNGIDVMGGFIIGFDNDTLDAFDLQYRFIIDNGIQVAMIGLLMALPKTPLHKRLKQEGRLIPGAEDGDNTKPGTNFTPKRMDYDAMVQAHQTLYKKLVRSRSIADRICNKTRYLKQPVGNTGYAWRQQIVILRRLFFRGVLKGGPVQLYQFVRTLLGATPRAWPQVMVDWISGLAMQDYVKRCFKVHVESKQHLAQKTYDFFYRTYTEYLQKGSLQVSLQFAEKRADLALTLKGMMADKFYPRTARRLEKLMRCTATTVTLYIDELYEGQSQQLGKLLKRLARYGDRVSIRVNQKVRHLLPIDSSVFHVVLD